MEAFDRIDARLDRPGVHYVPNTRLGRDLDFVDLATRWGFSAVVLANGAGRDRPLPAPDADEALGHGLVYQNAYAQWFNRRDDVEYSGPQFDLYQGAVVVGGGLASLDVVKMLQLDCYYSALENRGLEVDLTELEHRGIPRYCKAHGIGDPATLGVGNCTLVYRRRVRDMPLAAAPLARKKILQVALRKYLFQVVPQRQVVGFTFDDDWISGVRLVETRVEDGEARPVAGTEYVHPTFRVVSSIGSIPQPIEGIERDGVYYRIEDPATGAYGPLPHVFAVGNVVTGRGNIKASTTHAEQVAHHLVTRYLAEARVPELSPAELDSLLARTRARQTAVGYQGSYRTWIADPLFEQADG